MNQVAFLDTLLVVGTLALAIAFIVYQIRKTGWLKQHGRCINAVVTAIRHETGRTPSGISRNNYYVTAKWTSPQTGKTYTFWTWIINSCPRYTKGNLMPVLIDPCNPKRYTIEL